MHNEPSERRVLETTNASHYTYPFSIHAEDEIRQGWTAQPAAEERAKQPVTVAEFNDQLVAYRPLVMAQLHKYGVRDREQREEWYHDIIIYALARRDEFDPELSGFGTWIRWLIIAVWARNRRHAKRRRRHECQMLLSEDGSVLDIADSYSAHPDDRIDLNHAIETMRNLKDGDIVFEILIMGKRGVELAKERGVSPQAIQQALSRAQARLVVALTDPEALKPKDTVSEPYEFALRQEHVTSACGAHPEPQGGEHEAWRADRVMMTSTSSLTRFVAMLQAAGVTMPTPPVAEGRSILSLHH
ncbi:sigma-70 family RNA polymerase sigma factor [Agrobacterium rhizogenes]|nr:sigma-70 family RNA polymerase sigma factor [Rhizobium rhizogenes]NTF75130.1 sigma-70 family RNA polymerase sigma factor [Rhizobium rhizogenes]NTH51524.1 sigma-70 family RNA polymerase sigma factor [Rhizobium rhizogenes]NTH71108.1 sigma-70 family RNA polymerase sigma factor [Rhizobium rhizogenes]